MRCLILLLCSLQVSNCFASDLYSAIESTLRHDPEISSKSINMRASEYALRSSRGKQLPSISSSANSNRTESKTYNTGLSNDTTVVEDWGYSISASQPIYDPTIRSDIVGAKLDLDRTNIEQQQTLSTTFVNVVDTYFSYLKLRRQLKTTQLELRSSVKRLSQVQRQVDLGALGKTELYEAMTTNQRVRNQIIDLSTQLNTSKSKFFSLTFMSDAPSYDILDDTSAVVALIDELLLETNQSYELALRNNEIKKSDVEITRATAGFKPNLSLSATYSFNNTDSIAANVHPLNGDTDSLVYSLNLSIPLFAGGSNVNSLKEKKLKKLVARNNLEKARIDSRIEVERLSNMLVSHQLKIERLTVMADVSRKSYLAIKKANELGTRTLTDVLDAEKRMFDASRDLVSAKYDLYIDYVKLCNEKGHLTLDTVRLLSSLLIPRSIEGAIIQ